MIFIKIIIEATVDQNQIKGTHCFTDIKDEFFAIFLKMIKIEKNARVFFLNPLTYDYFDNVFLLN